MLKILSITVILISIAYFLAQHLNRLQSTTKTDAGISGSDGQQTDILDLQRHRETENIIRRIRLASGDASRVAEIILQEWRENQREPTPLLNAIGSDSKRVEVLNLINELLFADPDEFAAWVAALGKEGENSYTLTSVGEFGDYVKDTHEDAAEQAVLLRELLVRLPDNLSIMRRSLLRKELKLYLGDGIDSLAGAFIALREQEQADAASFVFDQLIKEDPSRAIDVFNKMSISDEKTEVHIAKTLIQSYARVEPDSALAWINTIEDKSLRSALFERAAISIGGTENRNNDNDYPNLIEHEDDRKIFSSTLAKFSSK